MQKSGVLEMIKVEKNFFANMTAAEKFGVDRPKGVLIAGLPGCGKPLSVKAAASLFKIPLIPGHGAAHGQSSRSRRRQSRRVSCG